MEYKFKVNYWLDLLFTQFTGGMHQNKLCVLFSTDKYKTLKWIVLFSLFLSICTVSFCSKQDKAYLSLFRGYLLGIKKESLGRKDSCFFLCLEDNHGNVEDKSCPVWGELKIHGQVSAFT